MSDASNPHAADLKRRAAWFEAQLELAWVEAVSRLTVLAVRLLTTLADAVTPAAYSTDMTAVSGNSATVADDLRRESQPDAVGVLCSGFRPRPSAVSVAQRMAKQRQRDTAPELALRRRLFARGLRYRVAFPVPGYRRCTVDVAFTRRKVAVFVDGCFWHRCPEHGTSPKANGEWWSVKLDANVARDCRVNQALTAHGWSTVRIWEHETVDDAVSRVLQALGLPGVATTDMGQ